MMNSTSTNYKTSTKTQIQYKNSINAQNKMLNRQNKNDMEGQSDIKEVPAQKLQTP